MVLDLLHNLMDVLSQRDTSVQRNIMKWKYMLLDSRFGPHSPAIESRLRKARENGKVVNLSAAGYCFTKALTQTLHKPSHFRLK